jgi:RIO kinase 1
LLTTNYGRELWSLYERGVLTPETALTGRHVDKATAVDVGAVLREIDDARAEEAARLVRVQAARS